VLSLHHVQHGLHLEFSPCPKKFCFVDINSIPCCFRRDAWSFYSFSLLAAKTLHPLFEGGMTSLVLRTRSGEPACLVTKTVVTISAFICIADLFLVLVKALKLWSCILYVRLVQEILHMKWVEELCPRTKPPTFIKWSHGSMWLVFSKSVAKIKTQWVVQDPQLQEFEDLPDKRSDQQLPKESAILVIKLGCPRLPVMFAIVVNRFFVIFFCRWSFLPAVCLTGCPPNVGQVVFSMSGMNLVGWVAMVGFSTTVNTSLSTDKQKQTI